MDSNANSLWIESNYAVIADRLYKLYYSYLRKYGAIRCYSCDDFRQAVYMKLIRTTAVIDTERYPMAYLSRTARTTYIDEGRLCRNKLNEVYLDDMYSEASDNCIDDCFDADISVAPEEPDVIEEDIELCNGFDSSCIQLISYIDDDANTHSFKCYVSTSEYYGA